MRRTLIGGLAIATMLSVVSAFPASATDPKPPPAKTPLCKTVYVNIATAPALSVTLGGKTQTVNINGVLVTSVTVCVSASAEVLANLQLNLDAPTVKDLCVYVNGSLSLAASANVDVNASVDVSITVNGKKGLLTPFTKTINFPTTPIGVDLTVPLAIVACDP